MQEKPENLNKGQTIYVNSSYINGMANSEDPDKIDYYGSSNRGKNNYIALFEK